MEIKIFTNGEPTELETLIPPKQINENIQELTQYFSFIISNMKMIGFLDQYMKYGK
jgi:hypothetical protein